MTYHVSLLSVVNSVSCPGSRLLFISNVVIPELLKVSKDQIKYMVVNVEHDHLRCNALYGVFQKQLSNMICLTLFFYANGKASIPV